MDPEESTTLSELAKMPPRVLVAAQLQVLTQCTAKLMASRTGTDSAGELLALRDRIAAAVKDIRKAERCAVRRSGWFSALRTFFCHFWRSLGASRYTGSSSSRNTLVNVVGTLSAVLFIFTVLFLLFPETLVFPGWDTKSMAAMYLGVWTIAPPTWFWAEYHLIWLSADEDERGDTDQFKHSQEVSRNIWLAFVGLLLAFFFKS